MKREACATGLTHVNHNVKAGAAPATVSEFVVSICHCTNLYGKVKQPDLDQLVSPETGLFTIDFSRGGRVCLRIPWHRG